jgi:hypothetical protein
MREAPAERGSELTTPALRATPPFQGGENSIPLLEKEGWRAAPGWSARNLFQPALKDGRLWL